MYLSMQSSLPTLSTYTFMLQSFGFEHVKGCGFVWKIVDRLLGWVQLNKIHMEGYISVSLGF